MRHPAAELELSGFGFIADISGALYWPEQRLLAVADMHLEKGSSFARRGTFLPPYDTATTLHRLAEVIARLAPRVVVALGDSFHDGDAPARLGAWDREHLHAMQRGRDWIWISGNHDPDPATGIGGIFADRFALGRVTFRHEPGAAESGSGAAEIAGHLHPVARVHARGRSLRRRCFVTDGGRMIMPAFGALTGGLNVLHAAFAGIFSARTFTAHMLGTKRVYAIDAARCMPD